MGWSLIRKLITALAILAKVSNMLFSAIETGNWRGLDSTLPSVLPAIERPRCPPHTSLQQQMTATVLEVDRRAAGAHMSAGGAERPRSTAKCGMATGRVAGSSATQESATWHARDSSGPHTEEQAGQGECGSRKAGAGLTLQSVSQLPGFHITACWKEEWGGGRRRLALLRANTQAFESSQGSRTEDGKTHNATHWPQSCQLGWPNPWSKGSRKSKNAPPLGRPLREGQESAKEEKQVHFPGACGRTLGASAEGTGWMKTLA